MATNLSAASLWAKAAANSCMGSRGFEECEHISVPAGCLLDEPAGVKTAVLMVVVVPRPIAMVQASSSFDGIQRLR